MFCYYKVEALYNNNKDSKSRDYKEGSHINERDRFSKKTVSQCPKQKHFNPVLLAIFNISGGVTSSV